MRRKQLVETHKTLKSTQKPAKKVSIWKWYIFGCIFMIFILVVASFSSGSKFKLNFETPMCGDEPQVWEFFSYPKNLEILFPKEKVTITILTTHPIKMTLGTLIDYKITLFGIPFSWQTRISAWNPPYFFMDESTKGPYRSWQHTHKFKFDEKKNVLMTDHVEYTLPFGFLGDFIGGWWVRIQLDDMFSYRNKVIKDIFPCK